MLGFHSKVEQKMDRPELTEADVSREELNTRLDLLYDVALKASSFSEVSRLVEQILVITQHIVKCSASSLLLVDESRAEMYFQAVEGPAHSHLQQARLDVKSGIAGWVARNQKPLLVNDVYEDGRFNREIDKTTNFVTRSVIAVPVVRGRKTIGVLEVLNKVDGGKFDDRDLAVLTGFTSTEALILLVSMSHTAINNLAVQQTWMKGYKQTIEALAQAADAKEPYAWGHSERVRGYTMLAAKTLSFSPEELQAIEFGALLHDIGKIGINESILSKSGPLNGKEMEIMHKHPEVGAGIVGEIAFLEKSKAIVLHHHERYDGKGYPKRLKGEHIPLGARLVAVADAFDTMITSRSYREAYKVEDAIDELIACKGSQFCPLAVETFVSALNEGENPSVEKIGAEMPPPEAGDNVPETAAAEVNETDLEMLDGAIQIVLPSVDSAEQIKQFKRYLKKVEALKITMSGWSEDEGHTISVVLGIPVPLIKILKEIPLVGEVKMGRENIEVRLHNEARDTAVRE